MVLSRPRSYGRMLAARWNPTACHSCSRERKRSSAIRCVSSSRMGVDTLQTSTQSRWNIRTASSRSPVGCTRRRWKFRMAFSPVRRLGKLGAYTHALGRYWAYETLKREAKILAALAHRYPQIVVDEAQDIGSMQVALLELLVNAGSEITLIGDPNQAIFEFCGADGSYLRAYPARTGAGPKDLTI